MTLGSCCLGFWIILLISSINAFFVTLSPISFFVLFHYHIHPQAQFIGRNIPCLKKSAKSDPSSMNNALSRAILISISNKFILFSPTLFNRCHKRKNYKRKISDIRVSVMGVCFQIYFSFWHLLPCKCMYFFF